MPPDYAAYGSRRSAAVNIETGPRFAELFGDPQLWGVSPHELFRHVDECFCDSCIGADYLIASDIAPIVRSNRIERGTNP